MNLHLTFVFLGKSLYIRRLYEKLKLITKKPSQLKCIRLIEPRVDENAVLQSMINGPKKELTIFHFDITSSVIFYFILFFFENNLFKKEMYVVHCCLYASL